MYALRFSLKTNRYIFAKTVIFAIMSAETDIVRVASKCNENFSLSKNEVSKSKRKHGKFVNCKWTLYSNSHPIIHNQLLVALRQRLYNNSTYQFVILCISF